VKLKAPLSFGLLLGSLSLCLVGYADEHGRMAPRPPPRPFQAHPPGTHPHGPMVRQHPVRVLAPTAVVHGHAGWAHWEHPEFARPSYYWNWAAVHNVSCIAEDSYGDQYPVSEAWAPGSTLANMTDVEDDALDRCYSESGQDTTCFLATCTHI
jgi:hypothetical protein